MYYRLIEIQNLITTKQYIGFNKTVHPVFGEEFG